MAYYALRSNWHDNDERVTRRHRKTDIVTRSKSFHDLYTCISLLYLRVLHRGYNIVRPGGKYAITDVTCAICSISIPFHDLRLQLSSCNCLLSSLARSISPPFIFSATKTVVYALSNSRRCVRSTLLLLFLFSRAFQCVVAPFTLVSRELVSLLVTVNANLTARWMHFTFGTLECCIRSCLKSFKITFMFNVRHLWPKYQIFKLYIA